MNKRNSWYNIRIWRVPKPQNFQFIILDVKIF